MKSSLPPNVGSDDSETDDSSRSSIDSQTRPPLMRSPPKRLSDLSHTLTERRNSQSARVDSKEGEDDEEESGHPVANADNVAKASPGESHMPAAESERLAKLREAMNAKLVMQQRMRRSYGSPNSDGASPRASPVQGDEKESRSPSLNAMLARTFSTESSESTKTVRATQQTPPAGKTPARTPSYPFPPMTGTQKIWSSQFHWPHSEDDAPGGANIAPSGASTPIGNTSAFLPPGTSHEVQEDPRFPTPNLYEMVLLLNAEPGLEQWWATVTNMMHDHFRADRATLVVPRDPSDIENVPWGQKATFSMNGPEDFVFPSVSSERTYNGATRPRTAPKPDLLNDIKPQKLHPERLRPRLEARHSYAGHGKESREILREAFGGGRPAGPQRTVTHATGIPSSLGSARFREQRADSSSTMRHSSLGDPAFSSAEGEADVEPYAEVFSHLRDLDHEIRPLIEPGGVNRVLERGRVVTVTRDYLSENGDGDDNGSSPDKSKGTEYLSDNTPRPSVGNIFGSLQNSTLGNEPATPRDYEEYEQYPASPWSQSPAPSPAIRADEDANPFFASQEQQVEDSFNPASSPKDYSQLGQVEAIGVDRASTVIHIPLVHPTISQPMQSLRRCSPSDERSEQLKRRDTLDMERKAPIAVLSILTSTVPYPINLAQSLTLLGPHLATSLAISQQFSSTQPQSVTIRHRRTTTGQSAASAPMTIVPTSLEDIVDTDIRGSFSSLSGSVTSPSDYSRSPYSTASSIVGTPGWDPSTHGWSASRSTTGTPAVSASDMVDNYFEAKKRSGQRKASSHNAHAQKKPSHPAKSESTSQHKYTPRKSSSPTGDGTKTTHLERKANMDPSAKGELSPAVQFFGTEQSPPQSPQLGSSRHPMRRSMSHVTDTGVEKRHSQLHSYGADLPTSFGGLPSTAGLEPVTPGAFGHARKSSYPEDMPPPSERLLRTIIDSVPVQIFTAEPDTGKLTWVNSKFMVYRGLEARQVLDDPWQAIHPDDRHEFMSTWFRSLRTAQQLQQKVRLQRFDGHFRWFYVRAAPLKDKKQKIVHWIGTMMDFHDQNLAQETAAKQQETAASEAKYRALANSSPQIVFAVNKRRGITFCNTQWVQFSGQSESEALGVGFMDYVHPDDLAKCKLPSFDEGSNTPKNVPTSVPPDLSRKSSESMTSGYGSPETEKGASSPESSPLTPQMPQRKLSELAATGILKVSRDADGRPSYSTEVRLKSKDGDFRWHLVRILLAEPLLQNDEEEETWYGTCTDINDHKALERDLKETMDEKSRFLSNMSHEIRTPLNGITGMVNFLIDSSLTAEQMEHVNIIRASTEGLRGLINDILDLSKAEAGMIQLNMDWLYVRALIEEVNDLTSAMAIDKGLELNYLVEEEVPIQIKGDRFRIRQILLNIIGNAIKFTQKGEVFVRCSIHRSDEYELAQNELYIKFDVIDTGRGFNDKEAEALFKRFSQIDGSSTRQHGGTGLGLVISRQLAQLHGGDMRAKGTPGEGAAFTFFVKTVLPSTWDQPPTPLPTPGVNIPILPVTPYQQTATIVRPSIPTAIDNHAKPSPKFALEHTQTPSPYGSPGVGRESPAVSSASSDPSVMSTARSSLQSHRSSASSFMPDQMGPTAPIVLALPNDAKARTGPSMDPNVPRPASTTHSIDSTIASDAPTTSSLQLPGSNLSVPGIDTAPPMYSILVVCPLKYSREATVQHIDQTLPKNVPHQITAREHLFECQKMISGDDPVIFTHIVVVLQDIGEITDLISQVLSSRHHHHTSIVIITDLAQRKRIMEQAPSHEYDKLASQRRLRFVFKPLKPSRFAEIFDPQKEREMSFDRNHDSAQQVALTQKQVFEELKAKLGNKDMRVLLVEDNKTNQLVVLKFLSKVSINAETAFDGVECTEKVFSQPYGHYSIILCDLHMPNKDGYQTCKEIRKWERDHKYPHLPIIALSANVLGDVHEKCVASGFNSYLTKPVDFKELSTVLMTFMNPSDPSKPLEFMRMKRRRSVAPGR